MGLKKQFQVYDTNKNGTLEFDEFNSALSSFNLGLEDRDIETLFKSFDKNGDGVVDFKEFMNLVMGDLSALRQEILALAYGKLKKIGGGRVMIMDIKNNYNASKHPNVKTGKKSEEEQLTDFIETFEAHHNAEHNYDAKAPISVNEFLDYY